MVGSISGQSFGMNQIMMNQQKPPKPPAFENIDSSGDGYLDTTELSSFAEKMSEMKPEKSNAPAPPDADQMISDLDTNGDGLLSKTEFAAGPKKMGGHMPPPPPQENNQINTENISSGYDTNGDGTVDETEMKNAFASIMQKFQTDINSLYESGLGGTVDFTN